MTTPNLTITLGGTAKRRYRLLKRARGNHTLSGTVTTMGSEPDEDPALNWEEWFAARRRERFEDKDVYQLVVNHTELLFSSRLRWARTRANRTKRPDRKAIAQRELDAVQCEHDAVLEALPERSPGWLDRWSRNRGVFAEPPEESEAFLCGRDAEVISMQTSDRYTLVRAVVAGDPKLASRVLHALREILNVVDPAREDDERPVSLAP